MATYFFGDYRIEKTTLRELFSHMKQRTVVWAVIDADGNYHGHCETLREARRLGELVRAKADSKCAA